MKWSRLVLLFTAVCGASCQFRITEENLARTGAVLNIRRADSMSVWQDKTIRGLAPAAYAGLATAMALPPDAVVKLKELKGVPGSIKFGISVQMKRDGLFIGSAVPITPDGYFLTAAHCAGKSSHLTLGVFNRSRTLGIARARVVWMSAGATGKGPDFALLHAPLAPFLPITMADPDRLQIGLPVLTCGHSGSKPDHSGGKILSLSKPETDSSGARWRRVGHSAPTAMGDSGGPVIGAGGELLAITTAGYWRLAFPFGLKQVWGYQGLAVAPDPAWIESLIKQDRLQRNAGR